MTGESLEEGGGGGHSVLQDWDVPCLIIASHLTAIAVSGVRCLWSSSD